MSCNAFKLGAVDQLWFHAETIRWPKHEVQFRNRPDSNDTAWLITSAKEQLALEAEERASWDFLSLRVKIGGRRWQSLDLRVERDPVFGTGAASLYLPAFRKLAARLGLAPRQAA